MNMLLIVTGLIFLISMIVGYVRGFVRIVASLAATIATIVVVIVVSPYVSKVILKVTPLEKTMQQKCISLFIEQDEEQETNVQSEFTREEQIRMIESSEVPALFKDLLEENNNREVYETLGVTYFFEYVGSYIAKLLADMIAFVGTYIVISLIVRMILYVLGIISDLPLIGGVNRLAGAAVGVGTGLIIVWILFVAITLLYNTELGSRCLTDISENAILTFLYEKNILMKMITRF